MTEPELTVSMGKDDASREFDERLASLRAEIEAALEAYVAAAPGCPPRLQEAMHYSLLAGGKRLRPLLVLLAAEACGAKHVRALPAACATEMVHTYSLIHDDLPAMDDDDLRRGRPTSHKVFGEGMAILAGDALLTLAFEVLARDVQPAEVAAKCCAELAAASGRCGMVGGQADDLEGEGRDGTLAELESIHERKTGALLGACLRLGAYVAEADAGQVEALAHYGRAIGLAFQIIDDLLDVRGSEARLGKRARKDSAQRKLTYPGLAGEEASAGRAQALGREACEALAPLGWRAAPLKHVAKLILERDR